MASYFFDDRVILKKLIIDHDWQSLAKNTDRFQMHFLKKLKIYNAFCIY